jgi:outer membrane protein OmpA-like peptidoglycan-associated protein
MTHQLSSYRLPSTRHTLATLVLALLPLVTADAQGLPQVRVTTGDFTIHAMRHSTSDMWKLTQPEVGAVFEVIAVDGDHSTYRESNHYLVLLPRDPWGTQWVGWIPGRHVELLPPRPRVANTGLPAVVTVAAAARPRTAASSPPAAATTPSPAASPAAAGAPAAMPEVVLQFAFDRSDLAEAAKHTLATALTTMGDGGGLSFSLGGHADATGPDGYNQKLGLARAEAVRKYIAEQLKVPADRISVSSFGETRPVASNDSPSGRAENRRVVVTVTAAAASSVR